MDRPVMISVKNLKKSFGDTVVLRDIDAEIHEGEVVVVVGSGNFESKRNIQRYISYKTKTLIPLKITII